MMRCLFHGADDLVAMLAHTKHVIRRLVVVGDCNSEVQIACEPWLCSHGHGNAIHHSTCDVGGTHGKKVSQRALDRVQRNLSRGTGTPGPSPSSAPGRSSSQASSSCSISSGDAWGCRRRRLAAIMSTPSSNRSKVAS